MTRNVYLMQTNENFGGNVFLPYSVASIWAYASTFEDIKENYDLAGLIFMRESVEKIVDGLKEPDVFGISCYIWNWQFALAVAKAVKAKYPNCLILAGGPQVPTRSEGFFEEHPQIDILVHFEGEETFVDILRHRLNHDTLESYEVIPGISYRNAASKSVKTEPRENAKDLSKYPSPYEDGMFDEILKLPYSFQAYQETHRGCPYSCTFCDWGSAVYTKVRAFSDERVLSEIDWFGRNKIEYLLNCDANFGILKRDEMIVDALIDTKLKYGYPQKFLASYAKNSGDKIFRICTKLNKYGLTKGVNLSLQSIHEPTLELIKRKNIAILDFEKTLDDYHAEGVSTVTEIIMALPGETYDTFCNGIDRLLVAGQHDTISIYRCSILANSEMAAPEYLERHGTETVRSPMTLNHGLYPTEDDILEWHDTVVATNTMDREAFAATYEFSWAIQTFHCLALLQIIAIAIHKRYDVRYRDFYEAVIDASKQNPDTVIGKERKRLNEFLDAAISGQGLWHVSIPGFDPNVNWPMEEVSFLNIVQNKEHFYTEFLDLLVGPISKSLDIELDLGFAKELVDYQAALQVSPFGKPEDSLQLNNNLPAMLAERTTTWEDCEGQSVNVRIMAGIECDGDLERFAREVVWYGRKGGKFLARVEADVTVKKATA